MAVSREPWFYPDKDISPELLTIGEKEAMIKAAQRWEAFRRGTQEL